MDFGVNLEDDELQRKYGAYSGQDLAKTIYKKYFDSYQGVKDLIEEQKQFARKEGYVKTILGRKVWIPEINSSRRKYRSYGERLATNGAIQGCLRGDSKIWVKGQGLKSIEELDLNNQIELWSGKEFTKGTPTYSGKKEEYEIELSNGRSIFCSKDHKFLTVGTNGNEIWKTIDEFNKVEKIRMSEKVIDKGNEVIEFDNVDREKDPSNTNDISFKDLLEVTDKVTFGQMLGRLASDGYVRKNKTVTWIYAEHEKDVGKKIEEVIPWKYTKYVRRRSNRNQPIHKVSINSAKLAREAYDIGINQKIPSVAKENIDILRGFLSGYTDGDGGLTGNRITVAFGKGEHKRDFAKELSKAFSVFNIEARVYYYEGIRTNLSIRKRDIPKFQKEIGFMKKKKIKKLDSIDLSKLRESIVQGRVLTVREVRKTGRKVPMYDIMNTDNGYFMTDGIITHNSASDVMMQAQINLENNKELKNIGLEQILQVHDESVVQVPKDSVDEAMKLIKTEMDNPFKGKVETRVPLLVDQGFSSTYYGAK
jgi:intein/homing endonuclease